MKRLWKYLLIMVVPLCVLMTRPVFPELILRLGQEIRLATRPFDPRDLFRGDFVELRFAIEEISSSLFSSPDASPTTGFIAVENDTYSNNVPTLYVTLTPDEKGIWQPVRLSEKAPDEGTYVKGRRLYSYYYQDVVQLDYGNNLRRFYVPENTGLELENAARRGEAVAVVKTWRGHVVLEKIEIQNKKDGTID